MKTTGKFTKIAVAIAITGALVAPASSAFAGEKTKRAVLGAVIGGIAGAAVGNGKTDAVAIGAVAGAALGATTAKSKYDRRYSQSYRTAPRYSDNRYGHDNRYDRGGYRNDRYDARHDNRYAYGYRR
jgi:uncharacterized protein YcfJ